MPQKRLPYIFIGLLTLILIFIIGLRWGQSIERTNKTINYLISIPPTATLAPTQPPLGFKTYKHTVCGVQFLYPDTYEVVKESSNGAMLQEKEEIKLSFDCAKTKQTVLVASESVKLRFQNKPLVAMEKQKDYIFQIQSPRSGIIISFFINKNLFPLFEKSLEFITNIN